MTTKAVWYHKRANLDPELVSRITKELQDAIPIIYPEFAFNKYLVRGNFHDKIDQDLFKELLPSMAVALKQIGIYDMWHRTGLVSATSYQPVKIHRDDIEGSVNPKTIALNFPIYNCEESITSFYEIKEGVEIIETQEREISSGKPWTKIADSCLEEVDSVVISEPTWLRVNKYHGVKLKMEKTTRIAASLRFRPEPLDYVDSL
jgi:hypothetical protein